MSELEEQTRLNKMAESMEMVAVSVHSYRKSLVEKGIRDELADNLTMQFAGTYWEALFSQIDFFSGKEE